MSSGQARYSISSARRQKRVEYTKLFMTFSYKDPTRIAVFFGVSTSTAEQYMREARYIEIPDDLKQKISQKMKENKIDAFEAIAQHYNRGCFIATAAYGTPFSEEIKILKLFRDRTLSKFVLGQIFIDTYYLYSPKIAKFIAKSGFRRWLVRFALNPAVFFIKLFMFPK